MKSNNTSPLGACFIAVGKSTTGLGAGLAPHGDFDEKGNVILLIALNRLKGMKPMDFFPSTVKSSVLQRARE